MESGRRTGTPRSQSGLTPRGSQDHGALTERGSVDVSQAEPSYTTHGSTADGSREAARQRAAFAAIERLRAEQNAELRVAVESGQKAEAERTKLLGQTPEGADRVRLQKLLKLERERADSDLMALTAEHELELAEHFSRLGVTR